MGAAAAVARQEYRLTRLPEYWQIPGWPEEQLMMLARPACASCKGRGWVPVSDRAEVCACVYRAVCRSSMEAYRNAPLRSVLVRWHMRRGSRLMSTWSRPLEEFRADIERIVSRVLNRTEQRIWREHMVERREWREVAPRVGMDRGNFYHAVYRIEKKLGRAFAELRPYPLWPWWEYTGEACWQ